MVIVVELDSASTHQGKSGLGGNRAAATLNSSDGKDDPNALLAIVQKKYIFPGHKASSFVSWIGMDFVVSSSLYVSRSLKLYPWLYYKV